MNKPDKIIFAIGGGELGAYETLPIDKQIVAAADKQRSPHHGKIKALFIPTASGDDPEYIEKFEKIYGYTLGCSTDYLLLYGKHPTRASLKRLIDWCDLVYIGGGSTPAMIRMWRKYDIDKYLKQAWKNGTVMAGLSAGANCWFRWGLSDAYVNRWTTVSCLGFFDYACNVHYSSQPGRKLAFDKLVAKKQIAGIAIEDNACIKITDTRFEIIKSDNNANVFRVYCDGDKVYRVVIMGEGELA